ncbi:MAG: GNAT family N-acetyltransferase [Roseobacter sp.]|jgi:GNAT superfamily N-acetyltransferase|nr:GNAT family N-acetyltransferase [Roseobacter sp.]
MSDRAILVAHFQRLDAETRRLRFGSVVNDAFVKDYAGHILSIDSVVYGAFADGELRGVAELHGVLGRWHPRAEAALLVEPAWQNRGLGGALMGHLIAAARNRGLTSLRMICLRENHRMQRLAKKHDAVLSFDTRDVEARLGLPRPTPQSLTAEMVRDTKSYLSAIFHLPA